MCLYRGFAVVSNIKVKRVQTYLNQLATGNAVHPWATWRQHGPPAPIYWATFYLSATLAYTHADALRQDASPPCVMWLTPSYAMAMQRFLQARLTQFQTQRRLQDDRGSFYPIKRRMIWLVSSRHQHWLVLAADLDVRSHFSVTSLSIYFLPSANHTQNRDTAKAFRKAHPCIAHNAQMPPLPPPPPPQHINRWARKLLG